MGCLGKEPGEGMGGWRLGKPAPRSRSRQLLGCAARPRSRALARRDGCSPARLGCGPGSASAPSCVYPHAVQPVSRTCVKWSQSGYLCGGFEEGGPGQRRTWGRCRATCVLIRACAACESASACHHVCCQTARGRPQRAERPGHGRSLCVCFRCVSRCGRCPAHLCCGSWLCLGFLDGDPVSHSGC